MKEKLGVVFLQTFIKPLIQSIITFLEHYGICGIANDWFKSYLSDKRQSVSIKGFSSNHAVLKHGVPLGSVLGPILFFIYINDLNHAIKYCKVLRFVDDKNLLHFNSSTKRLNTLVNLDMKHISVWLNANKTSLTVQNTELVIL